MEYTSTLATLGGYLNALARHSTHQVGAWAIVYPFVKVKESRELLMVVNKVPNSL